MAVSAQLVGAVAAQHRVLPAAASQVVVAGAAAEDVAVAGGDQEVIAGAAEEQVLRSVSGQVVVPGATADDVYGARPLKRVIQRNLVDVLALRLLEGEFPKVTSSGSTPPR